MDVKGEKDEKSENEGKDAMINGKPPSPTAATADVNKPASPSKDIAKSAVHMITHQN